MKKRLMQNNSMNIFRFNLGFFNGRQQLGIFRKTRSYLCRLMFDRRKKNARLILLITATFRIERKKKIIVIIIFKYKTNPINVNAINCYYVQFLKRESKERETKCVCVSDNLVKISNLITV